MPINPERLKSQNSEAELRDKGLLHDDETIQVVHWKYFSLQPRYGKLTNVNSIIIIDQSSGETKYYRLNHNQWRVTQLEEGKKVVRSDAHNREFIFRVGCKLSARLIVPKR